MSDPSLAEWLAAGGAVGSIIVGLVVWGSARRIGKLTTTATALDLVSRFSDEFESERVRRSRRALAACRQTGQAVPEYPHLGNVLNVFEGFAWAVEEKVVSVDLAWSVIGDWVMYYWLIF